MPSSSISPFGVQDWIRLTLIALLAIGFAAAAGLFLWRFYRSMNDGEELRIDYHWGGLGGGLGGWRISKPFGYLFATFALSGLLAVAVINLQPEKAPAAEQRAGDQKAADQKKAEQKPAEQKATERKDAEQTQDPKTPDPKTPEQKTDGKIGHPNAGK